MGDYKPVVLMVEDNQDVLRINSRALTRAGCEVECAETLEGARCVLAACMPDVIVLDILLPDGNGLEFLPELREQTDAPVLFLSSMNAHSDVLDGIGAGGDDYITKPYMLDELIARVAALWRREELHREKSRASLAEAGRSQQIAYGPLELDIYSMRAHADGRDLQLTYKEFLLLLVLLRHVGQTLDKETIYRQAWGAEMANDSQALYTAISRLKKKLGGCVGIKLTAVRHTGYRLAIK